jgi:hypothetical protein
LKREWDRLVSFAMTLNTLKSVTRPLSNVTLSNNHTDAYTSRHIHHAHHPHRPPETQDQRHRAWCIVMRSRREASSKAVQDAKTIRRCRARVVASWTTRVGPHQYIWTDTFTCQYTVSHSGHAVVHKSDPTPSLSSC